MTLRPPSDALHAWPRSNFTRDLDVLTPEERADFVRMALARVVLHTGSGATAEARASDEDLDRLTGRAEDLLAALPFGGEVVLGTDGVSPSISDAARVTSLRRAVPWATVRYRSSAAGDVADALGAVIDAGACAMTLDLPCDADDPRAGFRRDTERLARDLGLERIEIEDHAGAGSELRASWRGLDVEVETRAPWPPEDRFTREHPCILTRTELALWASGEAYVCHQQAPWLGDPAQGDWRDSDLQALFRGPGAMAFRRAHWTASEPTPPPCGACPYPARVWQVAERRRLSEFRDAHRGQRCFVIGNSPSLKELDLTLLENEVTFGVNRVEPAYRELGLPPVTYYCASDPNSPRHVDGDFSRVQARQVFMRWPDMDRGHPESIYIPQHDYQLFMKDGWFPRDIAQGATRGKTVVNDLAIPLAYFMGFDEVILIGVDLDWMDTGESGEKHFYADASHDMTRYVKKVMPVDEMLQSLTVARGVFEADGRRLVNASPRGRVDVLPRVSFASLFESSTV